LFIHYKGWYNTISRSAQSLLPEKERFVGVIYNAIDCASYPFNGGERDDYLLYLSRISPEKGTHLAIQVARKLGRRLIIAGNVDAVDQQYFQSQVSPQIDGKLIQFVGEADYYHHEHRELLFEGLAGKPNLLPILETGEWGDFWVLVMPRAEKSLRENLAEHGGSLPIHGGLDVPSDIVTALASLEDDVVHRDLKPENILLFEGIERLSIKYGWG